MLNSDGNDYALSLHSRDVAAKTWNRSATARVSVHAHVQTALAKFAEVEGRCKWRLDSDVLYVRLSARGMEYGPSFRCLRGIRTNHEEAIADILVPRKTTPDTSRIRLLDAAFQLIGAIDSAWGVGQHNLPIITRSVDSFSCVGDIPARARAAVRIPTLDPQRDA